MATSNKRQSPERHTMNQRKSKTHQPYPVTPLVGQFFHSLDDKGKIKWQGVVIGNPEPGWYLVQLCEWIMGDPNVRRLVQIQDMANWLFYEDAEAMNFSYKEGVAREGGSYRD